MLFRSNDAGNLNGEWPGAEATHVEGNIYSYTWTADSVPTGIIFNNGNNGVQTQNIDGGETASKTDASKTVKNPAIEWGKLYKATGEGIEDPNGNTNVVVAATEYKTAEPSATESKKEEPSDDKTVATGDTSAAWVLLAVVAASLGTFVVMTKKQRNCTGYHCICNDLPWWGCIVCNTSDHQSDRSFRALQGCKD